jgi:hypothetical protein
MAERARRALFGSLCFATLLALPAVASAAGLELPENGAIPLSEGGTAVASPGTAYGLEFNPALLGDLEGLDFRVDFRFVPNSVTFTRATFQQPSDVTQNYQQVSNTAPLFWAPGIYAGFRGKDWPVAVGLGLYGPPGIGWFTFPDPRNLVKQGSSYASADQGSGQRYTLIQNSNTIQLPTLALAWHACKWFSIGLSVQLAIANLSIVQAVAAGSNAGYETVDSDAYANVSVSGTSGPIFLPGVMIHPIEHLTIGAEYQSAYTLNMPGYITISAIDPSIAISQNSRHISLQLPQPDEARLGASYEIGRFTVAVEGKYEGWHRFNQIILNGTAVTIKSPTLCAQSPSCSQNVGIQATTENWKDAWGGRVGGSYRILTEKQNGIGLQVHLGALYETNAVPPEYQTLQAVTGNRFGGSAGITLSYLGFGLTLAAMGYVPVTLTITDSKVDRGVSGIGPGQTDLYPVYIGNGTYTASYWITTLGLSYSAG